MKKAVFFSISTLVLIFTVTFILITNNNGSSIVSGNSIHTVDNLIIPSSVRREATIQASYSDYSRSFERNESSSICYSRSGNCWGRKSSEFAVTKTAKVKDTFRGKCSDNITICQLGILSGNDSEQLIVGETYILFLGEQEVEKNKYYIVGARVQGTMHVLNGKIEAIDSVIKKDLEKSAGNNLSSFESF